MTSVCTLLLLSLSLQLSEAQHSFVILSGDVVSLPCGAGSETDCSRTNWTRMKVQHKIQSRPWKDKGKVLIQAGSVLPTDMSDRLNLTKSCELQIRNVRPLDAGEYVCNQLNQSKHSTDLSVVTFQGGAAGFRREMICDVYAYGGVNQCGHTVRWLVQDSDQNHTQFEFRTSECSANVQYYIEKPSRIDLSCEVLDLNHNQVYVFQSPGQNKKKSGSNKTTELKPPSNSFNSSQHEEFIPVTLPLLMLVMRSLELAMVSVILVLLLRGLSSCRSTCHHQESERTRALQNKRVKTAGRFEEESSV